MDRIEAYNEKKGTPADAAGLVKSGDRVFIGFASSVAYVLTEALWDRRDELEDITIITSLALKKISPFSVFDPRFSMAAPFLGPQERLAIKNGVPHEITSFHLSQVDLWIDKIGRPDVAFIECSLPDENGNMSFGPSGGCVDSFAVKKADIVVAQVNRNVPYVYGGEGAFINVKDCHMIVEADDILPDPPEAGTDDVVKQISDLVVREIPDGATIQMGIGSLGNNIGMGLKDHNDLGIYTEMFVPSMMMLMKNGNVTNSKKGFLDGKSVFSFSIGPREMYEYMDHNPNIYAMPFPYVNDARNIAKNSRMISINAAMQVDLFGEVVADCMDFRQQSACGGQLDFVRGAQWSKGGKSIIALPSSIIKNGKRYSRIVTSLSPGTAVTTPRADVEYIATEYGCVNLKYLSLRDRVKALISLAHPDFRDELEEDAKKYKLI